MKILIVNDMIKGGGVERLMQDLIWYLYQENEITILSENHGVRDFEAEKSYPVNVQFLYRKTDYRRGRNFLDWKRIGLQKRMDKRKLTKKIREENFDLLLCMKEGWIMQFALEYGEHIPRRLAWVHTDYSASYYTKDFYQTAENEISYMKRYDSVIGVSQMIVDSIRKVIGDPGNLVLRYNPLDKQDILKKAMEPVCDIKRSDRPLFVTVGRLNYQKGFDTLLEVCNLLNGEGYQYDVWIIGGGEDWNRYQVLHDLEEQIRRYKLDNVYLIGPRSNPHKYIRMGDWFLSSSRYEGYSYVSQEATIIGTPVLLTDCSGVDELLEESKNGIVVENSVKGLYQGMREVVSQPELAAQYRASRVEFPQEHYEKERYEGIEELFRAN